MRRWNTAYLYVLAVPYIAALSAVQAQRTFGGFRFTGWIWAAMLLLGPLIFLHQRDRLRFPALLWLPWFGWVILSLLFVEHYELRNFQDACQILTPLVVGIVASVALHYRSQLLTLRRAFTHCLLILLVMLAGFAFAGLSGLGISYGSRATALTACFVGCMFVASLDAGVGRSMLGWAGCLALAAFTGSRMATLALLLVWAAYPLYRRPAHRLYAGGAALLLAVVLFYSPMFQARFFASGTGDLSDVARGDFSGTGRFESWPLIWNQAKHHLVRGAGVGEAAKFVPGVWPGVAKPHNDYLRVIFEQGLVGLLLFLAVILGQMVILRKKLRSCQGELRRAFAASYLGLFALLIVSITDNALVYGNWYMHPLFAVLGAAYGVEKSEAKTVLQTAVGVPRAAPSRLLAVTAGGNHGKPITRNRYH